MTITLKTLPQASAQEVFNQVRDHLLNQMKRSMSGSNMCLYRNNSGLSCAAGCLISKEEYSSDLEGKSWTTLTLKDVVPDTHAKLISELQAIHDEHITEHWEDLLKSLANQHNLTF